MEYEDNYVIFVDESNNYYGTLEVHSQYNDRFIHSRLKSIILDLFKSQDEFFEDFSANLSKVLEVFDKEISKQNFLGYTKFHYMDSDLFNVDKVF